MASTAPFCCRLHLKARYLNVYWRFVTEGLFWRDARPFSGVAWIHILHAGGLTSVVSGYWGRRRNFHEPQSRRPTGFPKIIVCLLEYKKVDRPVSHSLGPYNPGCFGCLRRHAGGSDWQWHRRVVHRLGFGMFSPSLKSIQDCYHVITIETKVIESSECSSPHQTETASR